MTDTATPTAADIDAIRNAALDYVLGYYDADPERMERAIHPRLAKRIPTVGANGRPTLGEMGGLDLVQLCRAVKPAPASDRVVGVEVLDVFKDIATVRADMTGWIDYMQLARIGDSWKIVNVLWQLR